VKKALSSLGGISGQPSTILKLWDVELTGVIFNKVFTGMASISYVGVLAKSMDERSRARRSGMS
jgi:hypothetical protein